MMRRKILAFTLIELLVTLSIMAIMAGMLFPFIQNYNYRAKTTAAADSLKTMQDAMMRFAQMNDDFDPNNWGGTAAIAGPWTYSTNSTTTNQVAWCARTGDGSYGDRIISDITGTYDATAASNQVIKLTTNLRQADYVLFYRTGPIDHPLTNMNFYPVFYNIDEANDNASGSYAMKNDYVDRHGDRVNNTKHPAFPSDGSYITNLFR